MNVPLTKYLMGRIKLMRYIYLLQSVPYVPRKHTSNRSIWKANSLQPKYRKYLQTRFELACKHLILSKERVKLMGLMGHGTD